MKHPVFVFILFLFSSNLLFSQVWLPPKNGQEAGHYQYYKVKILNGFQALASQKTEDYTYRTSAHAIAAGYVNLKAPADTVYK